jgi:outer membrane lipoprotein SlyB
MENPAVNKSSLSDRKTSPLVIGAAASMLLCSLLGIAALTGMLPSASSQKNGQEATVQKSLQSRIPDAGTCANCGTVESVRAVEVKGEGSGLGAVAGGVTGAVVGNQLGAGRGNTAMTIIGAAGGALAGNEIEKDVKKYVIYRVTVRMDDGSYRTVSRPAPVSIGGRVRVVDGDIVARS